MNSIFKDAAHQTAYKKDGFIILPLLSPEEVEIFIEFYKEHDEQPDEGGFYATMYHSDPEKKAFISDWITHRVAQALDKYVVGYRPLFGNFIVKAARNLHEVGIHQDWTYVDELQYRSFNVWTSLCATNSDNGGMYVLPKSHHIQMPIRYTPFDGQIYESYRAQIKKASIPVVLKAGEAMLYDSSLLHYSNRNHTNESRPACGCVFIPEHVTPLHYYKEEGRLIVYPCDKNFFNEFNPGVKPNRAHSEIIDFVGDFDVLAFEALLQED